MSLFNSIVRITMLISPYRLVLTKSERIITSSPTGWWVGCVCVFGGWGWCVCVCVWGGGGKIGWRHAQLGPNAGDTFTNV